MGKVRYGVLDKNEKFTQSSSVDIYREFDRIRNTWYGMLNIRLADALRAASDYKIHLGADGNFVIALDYTANNIVAYEMCNKQATYKVFTI